MRSRPGRRYLVAAVGIVILVVLFATAVWFHPSRPTALQTVILSGIQVSFRGSGASVASASGVCPECPLSITVGTPARLSFSVQVPPSSGCSHQYSISRLYGPTIGALVVSNATGGSGPFPITIPFCVGNGGSYSAPIEFELSANEVGVGSTGLSLTVEIDQIS